jgi:hypothetical protein
MPPNDLPIGFQVFLSYAGDDAFEASLFQFAVEQILCDLKVTVWTYQRDQKEDERSIGKSLKERVRESTATVFLVSPSTLKSGAAQWMELAYSDAYGIPTYVILHRLTFTDLRARRKGVPPLLLEGQCNLSADWRKVIDALRSLIISLAAPGATE